MIARHSAILALLFATPAAADAVILQSTPEYMAVVDSNSIQRTGNSVTVEVNHVFAYPQLITEAQSRAVWAQRRVSQVEFRCDEGEYREVSRRLYGFNDEQFGNDPVDNAWRSTGAPTSVMSFAYDLSCNGNDVGFEHRSDITAALDWYYKALESSFARSSS